MESKESLTRSASSVQSISLAACVYIFSIMDILSPTIEIMLSTKPHPLFKTEKKRFCTEHTTVFTSINLTGFNLMCASTASNKLEIGTHVAFKCSTMVLKM